MKTEHLLLMETDESVPTGWWDMVNTNTEDQQIQKESTHGTCSKPHGNIGNSSSREDHLVG